MADSRLNCRNNNFIIDASDLSQSTTGSMNAANQSTHFKPSKAFLDKCATSQQTLLDHIKSEYHDELRNLYQSELNADIVVKIGENFNKPLHGCILASRVFRFYNTLRLFKTDDTTYIQDSSSTTRQENSLSETTATDIDPSLIFIKQVYSVPSELISPELFKNFTRRIYLDEDVHDEELRLTTKFGDWIKLNRPHLIRNIHIPKRYSPNHKLTFRTIIPDFDVNDSATSTNNTTTITTTTTTTDTSTTRPKAMSTEPDSNTTNNNNNRMDSLDKISKPLVGVLKNEEEQSSTENNDEKEQRPELEHGAGASSLSRTDTFERLTLSSNKLEKTDSDAQLSSMDKTITSEDRVTNRDSNQSSSMNAHLNSSQDDDRSDYGADISSVDGSNAPTPTSNAQSSSLLTSLSSTKDHNSTKSNSSLQSGQIVPKQRTSTIQTASSTSLRQSLSQQNNEISSKNKSNTANNSAATTTNKASSKGQDYQPVAQKRANSISNKVSATSNRVTTTTKATQQQPLTNPMVARAKPISLERAQSPILVGKQSRHQFKSSGAGSNSQTKGQDRKTTGTPQQQADYESETLGSEISDSGSYAIDASSSGPGGYVSIDRHTLASYSRLAEAMTRMFLEEIESDVVINVGGSKRIKAHKCILATRSAYLAEAIEKQHSLLLENNCLEQPVTVVPPIQQNKDNDVSNDNEAPVEVPVVRRVEEDMKQKQVFINLTDFSYATVHFAVLHLYSGIVTVTDELELEELAKLTHLLHVGTLRQVCQHNLRMTFCHFFHKPCNICTLGVLKALPLAWRYDYSDLYTKCLQWIGTYFAQIFCLKEFSELRPTDLIEECYAATLNQLQPDNIIQRTLECQKLLKNLPRVKWSETIVGLVGRQLEDFCHYVADNYDKIIQTESFMGLGKNCWECEILEENLLAAMNHLKPDMGCKCLVLLHKIECSNETFNDDSANHFSESFANLVCKMRKYCERYLIREAAQVVHCSSWKQMNLSLQRKIKDQALITVDFDDPTRHLSTKPKLTSSMNRRINQQSPSQHHHPQHSGQNSGSDDGNRSSTTKSSPSAGVQLPPMKSKKIVSRHVKV